MSDRSQVKRGIALLDRKLGQHWPRKVKRSRLRMIDGHDCILGQLFGSYRSGGEALGIRGSEHLYGFAGGVAAEVWVKALRGRR